MIAALVAECRRHRYYGIQFDFENIALSDAGALTDLFRQTAAALRQAGCKLSIAVVPRAEDPGKGDYAKYMFENWRGPYDLKAIAPEADFVSLMTYDQHTRHTPPGPIAGMPWLRAALDYALQYVRPEKLSVGIPLYGRRWYAGMRDKMPAMLVATVFGSEAGELAAQSGAVPQWDPVEASPWFLFHRDGIREWVFYTDASAFRARYDVARTKRLHGFSAWVLGMEDPAIWGALPER
jgi:spore germination protein YaaH